MSGIFSGASDIVGAGFQLDAEQKQNNRDLQRQNLASDVGTEQAQEKGNYQAAQIRQQVAQLGAKQRTAYANSGVDSTVGTAAQVQANTSMQGELDAQMAKNNAAREVWGYQQAKKQAQEDFQAKNDAASRKAAGTVVGGAGKLAGGVASLMGGG
jgi:hypothetical protein